MGSNSQPQDQESCTPLTELARYFCLTLKGSLAGYRIFNWKLFSFTLHISAHCLMASKVSDQKSDNLTENSLYVMIHFLFAAFKILFLFFQSLFLMCLGPSLFEFVLPAVCWDSWIFISHVFHQIQKVFCHYFPKYPLCPFLSFFFQDYHNVYVGLLSCIIQIL